MPGRLAIGAYTHDDDLIAATGSDGETRVRVYRLPETLVVLGRGSDPAAELHVDNCLADRVPVLRRRGGGCAVVVDPGNVIVSVTLHLPGLAGHRLAQEGIAAWLIGGLGRIGLGNVRMAGTSDLAIGDRKISGSCVYRTRGLLFYSATLLVDPDPQAVARYLRHPPREPDYRAGRSHEAFLGSMAHLSGVSDAEDVERRLRSQLGVPEPVNF